MNKKKIIPLRTEDRLNYSMMFAGRNRVFEKVTLTILPSEGSRETMSVAEFRRLSGIVASEVLKSNNTLLIGEVQTLVYYYKIKPATLEAVGLIDISTPAEARRWRYNLSEDLPLWQSLKIKDYFKSLAVPT